MERYPPSRPVSELPELPLRFLDHAPVGIFVMLADGRLHLVNRYWEETWGLQRQEVVGRRLDQVFPPDLARWFLQEDPRAVGAGAVLTHERPVVFPGGRREHLALKFPLRDPSGRVEAVGGILIDVTERGRAEEELRRSQEQLRALAARLQAVREDERGRIARQIHDELGQGLTALKMDLAWLGKRAPRPNQAVRDKLGAMRRFLDATLNSVRRLSAELRPGALDTLGLVAAMEQHLAEFQARTGLRCALRAPPEESALGPEGATAVFRIFQEALTNVARHARATRVQVRLFPEAGRVVLEVKDNGRGIAPEDQRGTKALGILGMRERATLLGGDVLLAGAPGRGTTLRAWLPLRGAAAGGGRAMIKVLVADDHPVVRQGLRQALAGERDMAVRGEARNGQEVLDLVRGQGWDVVVLDISMPGRDGLEVLKSIKQERPGVPVLILSVHPEDRFAVRALEAGAAGYLTKEAAPDELARAIRQVVGGERYISPSVAKHLALAVATRSAKAPHESLSDREYQVLRLIASGKTASQIAAALSLSVKTISTYRARILEKTRMGSNAELTRYALQHHLVE